MLHDRRVGHGGSVGKFRSRMGQRREHWDGICLGNGEERDKIEMRYSNMVSGQGHSDRCVSECQNSISKMPHF